LSDELAIGSEEIVIGEFAGENPGGLLEGVGGDFRLGDLSGEEMDFEFFGKRGVTVADSGNFQGFGKGDAQFFAKFAGEGFIEGFAGAYFAAWEFPLEGRSVSAAALADEDAAIGTFDDSCDDLEHWGNVSGSGRRAQRGADEIEASVRIISNQRSVNSKKKRRREEEKKRRREEEKKRRREEEKKS
jgi:hypothetical protein